MSVAGFVADVLPDARIASARTGVPVSVILAQWAWETGWGTSTAWKSGNNYAGVSAGGHPRSYPDRAAGLADYIATINGHNYDAVRSAHDPTAAAIALGNSPWAASHYNAGSGPGSDLLGLISTNQLGQYDGVTGSPGDVGGGSSPTATPVGFGIGTVTGWVKLSLFIAGGAALVVIGLYRGVAPVIKPKLEAAKEKANQAASTAAMAAAL